MSSPDDMADLQQQALKELVELGLEFSRELKAKIARVTSVEDAERLTLAFHRATRSVRLSLALMSKLACEQREVRRVHRIGVERAVETRKDQIRAVVAQDVWTETEGEEAEALLETLEDRLDLDGRFEDFLQGPVEAAIEAIKRDLGLAAKALGDPSPLAGEGGLPEEGRMRGLSDLSAPIPHLSPHSGEAARSG